MLQTQIVFKTIKDLDIEVIQQIKQKVYCTKGNNALYGLNKLSKQVIDQLQKLLNNNSNYFSIKEIIRVIFFSYDLSRCKICGKYLSIKKRNNTYCSIQCKFKDTQYRDKVKQTLLFKYGVSHNLKIKQVRQKALQSASSQQAKLKRKKTNLERYGYQVSSKNQFVKNKMIQTNLQKYGNKIGVSNYELLTKNSKEASYLMAWNNLKKYQKYIVPNFSFQQYDGIDKEYEWKCIKCGSIFKQKLRTTRHIEGLDNCPRCLNCYLYYGISGRISTEQKQLLDFCKIYFPNLKENKRDFISPYQIDILIPQLKLGIEFNGCYWHSLEAGSPIGYHLMKTQMVQSKGYRLIHVWQDDWTNNKEEIKKKLIDIFENKEIIDYSKILERDWYPLKEIQGYKLEVLLPQILIKNKHKIQNCGYLKYVKINKQ